MSIDETVVRQFADAQGATVSYSGGDQWTIIATPRLLMLSPDPSDPAQLRAVLLRMAITPTGRPRLIQLDSRACAPDALPDTLAAIWRTAIDGQ